MPGIYGCAGASVSPRKDLESMSRAMRAHDHFRQDEQFVQDGLAGSRVHLGNVGMSHSPFRLGPLAIWIEGEAYNTNEVASGETPRGTDFEEMLAEAYMEGGLDRFLAMIDGYFCAAIYDARARRVVLVSDRLGTRMLYWYHHPGCFVWSSEVKGILGVAGVDRTLDDSAFRSFMELGYLMGRQTWFRHIRLSRPATIMEYDIAADTCSRRYYWTWSEVSPSGMSFNEAVDRIGESFVEAVDRRFEPDGRVAISLSGGLDSRAILAAATVLYPDHSGYCDTFGQPGCEDIRIARMVAVRTKWTHQVKHLGREDWLEPRLQGIHDTDGMFDIKHMHAAGIEGRTPSAVGIYLNGYLGGEAIGDTYQSMHRNGALNQRISLESARFLYGDHVDQEDVRDAYFDVPHVEPFHFANRSRRFINMGTVSGLARVDIRLPFCANDVLETAFSIPDEYRLGNKLYSGMLLRRFPQFFSDIPWQKTGRAIGSRSFGRRILMRLRSMRDRSRGIPRRKHFHDYRSWVAQPGVRARLEEILCRGDSKVRECFGQNDARKYLAEHVRGETDRSDELLRLLTVEVYLDRAL